MRQGPFEIDPLGKSHERSETLHFYRRKRRFYFLLLWIVVALTSISNTASISLLQREEPGVVILNQAAEILGWPERTDSNIIGHTETRSDGGSVYYGITFMGEYQSYDQVYFIAGTGDSVVGGTEAWVQYTVSTEGAGDIEQRIYFKVGPWWFKVRVDAYPWRRGEHPDPDGLPVAEALYQATVDYLNRVEESPEPSPSPDQGPTPQEDLCTDVTCEPSYCASENESHFDGSCDPTDGQCYYWSQQCEAGCNNETGLCNANPDVNPTGPWDLSIQRLSLIQAIEGGQLVANKPTALRVYLNWPDTETNINAEVSLYIDGTLFKTLTHLCKHEYSPTDRYHNRDTANFHLPGHLLPPGKHTLLVQASLTALTNEQMHIEDPDPVNNMDVLSDVEFMKTRSFHLLMGSIHEDIDAGDILNYIARGRPYLMDVYPVEDVVILDTFYMIRNVYPDTMATKALNLALKRLLYNSQLPPGVPKADYSVGIFPDGHYDSMLFNYEVGGGSFWWGRNNVLVGLSNERPVAIHAIAHEIGHDLLFGRLEEYIMDQQHGVGFYLPSYSVIYKSQEGILEDLSATRGQYINFMGSLTNQAWVNLETWNQLVEKLGLPNTSAQSIGALGAPTVQLQEQITSGFVAVGTIGQDNSVQIDTLIWLDQIPITEISLGDSDFWFEIVDTQGQRLAAVPIIIDFSLSDPAPFIAVIPMNKGNITQLSITSQGKEIWVRTPSDNAPQIQLETPTIHTMENESMEVSWSAQDADGDSLTYTLFYSADAGTTWLPLASDLTPAHFTLDTSSLAGCDNCQIRVLASDGWHVSSATTEGTFKVPDKAPTVFISFPTDGAEILLGDPLTLLATAYDLEDGILEGSSVTWYSEKDGFLGEGARLTLSDLSSGDHVLNVYAYDVAGNAGQAHIQLHVTSEIKNTKWNMTTVIAVGLLVLCSLALLVLFVIGLVTRRKVLWGSALIFQVLLWLLAVILFIVFQVFD
jgi:hypothetical protein